MSLFGHWGGSNRPKPGEKAFSAMTEVAEGKKRKGKA
jgi:hypothetical protein